MIMRIMVWVLLWWRLWHVLIYDFAYYVQFPLKVFAFHEWGMSYIGWIVWVVTVLCWFFWYHKLSKKDILTLFDMTVVVLPFGSLLWRLWNFLNQELYGRPVVELFPTLSNDLLDFRTSLWIFYVYPFVDTTLRLNTNIIASITEWFLLLVIMVSSFFWLAYQQKKSLKLSTNTPPSRRAWMLSGLFLVCYSFVRFMLEFVRQDSQYEFVWFFSRSQWFFLLFICFWVYLIVRSGAYRTR